MATVYGDLERAQQRRYYVKNKEKIRERNRANWLKDVELSRKKKRDAYAKNVEAGRAARRKWYAANKEYCKSWWNSYGRTIKGLVERGKHNGRGLIWTITEDQLREIRANNCYYCSGALPVAGVGLDRIDNARGYEIDNVVPCCGDCNKHRGATWTVEEMKAAVNAVMNLRKTKCQ